MSQRINVYIRDITYQLLKDFCDINEYDKSRAVDEIIFGRLQYLKQAKEKALSKEDKETMKKYKLETTEDLKAFNEWKEENKNKIKGKAESAIYIEWIYSDYMTNKREK